MPAPAAVNTANVQGSLACTDLRLYNKLWGDLGKKRWLFNDQPNYFHGKRSDSLGAYASLRNIYFHFRLLRGVAPHTNNPPREAVTGSILQKIRSFDSRVYPRKSYDKLKRIGIR